MATKDSFEQLVARALVKAVRGPVAEVTMTEAVAEYDAGGTILRQPAGDATLTINGLSFDLTGLAAEIREAVPAVRPQ